MSDYINFLGVTEKKTYTAKLGMVGLTLEGDPYLPANAGNYIVTDMTSWPHLDGGHICLLYSMP